MTKYKIKKINKLHKMNHEQKKIYIEAFYSCKDKESIQNTESFIKNTKMYKSITDGILDLVFHLKHSFLTNVEIYFFYDEKNTLIGLVSFFYNKKAFYQGNLLYEIEYIYTKEKRVGHGTNIINLFEKDILNHKCEQIKINLSVEKDLNFLSSFYEKFGYKHDTQYNHTKIYSKIIKGDDLFWENFFIK